MSTDGIDFQDFPELPRIQPDLAQDSFEEDVAFKLAFVGIGQAGGRMAALFHELGYGAVCAINTAENDLAQLPLDDERKLDLGGGGAGKDPAAAAQQIAPRKEDVYDLFKRTLGTGLDYTFLCFGAGGGTGAGCWPTVAEVSERFADDIGRPTRTGAIVALPKRGEGRRPATNSVQVLRALQKTNISPIILIDNDKLGRLFAKTPVSQIWDRYNRQVATLLHLFNRLAAQDSAHTSFDRRDLAKLLDAGLVFMGAAPVTKYESPADISQQIRDTILPSFLADADFSTAKQAGCIFICGPDEYDNLSSDLLEHGFESLNRSLAPGAVVYRGVYRGTRPGVSCFVMVAGTDWPEDKISQLERVK